MIPSGHKRLHTLVQKALISTLLAALLTFIGGALFADEHGTSLVEPVLSGIISSHRPILGMHDTIGGEPADGYRVITELCGKAPGLWSSDFGFSTHPNDSVRSRGGLLPKMSELHSKGVLITLSWHQCNPIVDEPCTFSGGVQKPLSAAEWKDILTDGSPLNLLWKKQADRLASLLRGLQDQGIPVLLRPYHESNIPGFWWAHGDAAYPKALWKQLRYYYTYHWGLRNLLWVWSVSYHPKHWDRVSEYYPGDDVVDIVGLDIYPPTKDGEPAFEKAWNTLSRIAGKKPIALSEVSRLPSKAELKARRWAYVVPWGKTMLFRDNSICAICTCYSEGPR